MLLTKEQFEQQLKESSLVISIIGMSNVGKTFWAQRLQKIGFNHICCDDLVEKKLEPELLMLGYQGIKDVARWMGMPYDKRFDTNQHKYLEKEIEVMQRIVQKKYIDITNSTIIDTTGSIVHTGNEICDELGKISLVVYIEATRDMIEEMFNKYFKHPKPVLFVDKFARQDNETNGQALERCYPELLNYRSELYKKYADLAIPHKWLADDISGGQILELIKQYLDSIQHKK